MVDPSAPWELSMTQAPAPEQIPQTRVDIAKEKDQKMKTRGSGSGKKSTGVDTNNNEFSRCARNLMGLVAGVLLPVASSLTLGGCSGCFSFVSGKGLR